MHVVLRMNMKQANHDELCGPFRHSLENMLGQGSRILGQERPTNQLGWSVSWKQR